MGHGQNRETCTLTGCSIYDALLASSPLACVALGPLSIVSARLSDLPTIDASYHPCCDDGGLFQQFLIFTLIVIFGIMSFLAFCLSSCIFVWHLQ